MVCSHHTHPGQNETLWAISFQVQKLGASPLPDEIANPLTDEVQSFGGLLDPSFLMELQITSVGRSTHFHLRLVHQLCPFRDRNTLVTAMHALVILQLVYCNAPYVGRPLGWVQKLQLAHDAAAKLLSGPVLRKLSVTCQGIFEDLFLTCKHLNDLGPGELKEFQPWHRPGGSPIFWTSGYSLNFERLLWMPATTRKSSSLLLPPTNS